MAPMGTCSYTGIMALQTMGPMRWITMLGIRNKMFPLRLVHEGTRASHQISERCDLRQVQQFQAALEDF
eukprot:3814769-Amphidinium_carterae.1